MRRSSNTPPPSPRTPPTGPTPPDSPAPQRQGPRTAQTPADAHTPGTAPANPEQPAIDQPLPSTEPRPIGLITATPLPASHPLMLRRVQQQPPGAQTGIDAAALQCLLAQWPRPQPDARPREADSATPRQQTLALAVIQQPFLFEQLPADIQSLVLGAVLGEPEHLHSAAQASQLCSNYGHLLFVSQPVRTLTLPFRDRVLRCALRLTPHAPLPALPLSLLLGRGTDLGQPAAMLLAVLQALTQATGRLRSDEQACAEMLALGRQLLLALLSPHATPATQCALLCVPQLMVQALRARLHGAVGHAFSVTCTLKGLLHWSTSCGPNLAAPVLLELLFTVAQVNEHVQDELIESAEVALFTAEVEDTLGAVCVGQEHPTALIDGVYALVELMPDPWAGPALPAAPPSPQAITQALGFLASYPHAFIGFAQEALDYLGSLPLSDEQAALLEICRRRQAAPLQGPGAQ